MSYPSLSFPYTPSVNVLQRDQRMSSGETRPMLYNMATENPTNTLHAMHPPTSSLMNNVGNVPNVTNVTNVPNVTNVANVATTTMEQKVEGKTYNVNSILLTTGIVGILVCFLVMTLITKSKQNQNKIPTITAPKPKTN